MREESGLTVKSRKVLAVLDANRAAIPLNFYHAYKIIFLCDFISGELRSSNETLAADFFSFDALPPLSSARTNERHLAEIQAHLQDPKRAAAFD